MSVALSAAVIALSLGSVENLDQGQESEVTGNNAGH
jgi:hypothetical protein